jgi:cardiolipin synthase
MSHRLIVLPDDTAQAILDPVNSARHSLNIRMFLFTYKSLLDAVIAARHRGVNVRVMLNPARRDGTSDNEATRNALLAAGVSVRDSNSAFAVTHQKSMVIDDRIAISRKRATMPSKRRKKRKSRRWCGASMPIGRKERSSRRRGLT